jgi:hypothetical protein
MTKAHALWNSRTMNCASSGGAGGAAGGGTDGGAGGAAGGGAAAVCVNAGTLTRGGAFALRGGS